MGFLLDLIVGDPYVLPHPVRLMGRVIHKLEDRLWKEGALEGQMIRRGLVLVCLVLTAAGVTAFVLLYVAYAIHPGVGLFIEIIMTYQILATKCLKTESMKVYRELRQNNLEGARYAVSMIVGRDTVSLDDVGVTKAAVETVAENCSDGVIAPMLYLALGGPVLGFLYKAINTMDSMVGYQNDRYRYFGRPAARLDDIANFVPARISAVLMIAVSFVSGKEYSAKRAWHIFRRDRYKHASPNSAQTESVCAGALGIQLAGDAVYSGKTVKKPLIGDGVRSAEYEDIVRACRLLYRTAFLCEGICMVLLFLSWRLRS